MEEENIWSASRRRKTEKEREENIGEGMYSVRRGEEKQRRNGRTIFSLQRKRKWRKKRRKLFRRRKMSRGRRETHTDIVKIELSTQNLQLQWLSFQLTKSHERMFVRHHISFHCHVFVFVMLLIMTILILIVMEVSTLNLLSISNLN